ncbi:hypothetical protein BU23DRAFT_557478 [Bimuria novae-zelandiae CBS 107.79]|uniref:Uncharacterized protein n=1 Tax=Bimuria novae-zelandiae CBS 107.79 TaxID=1447943 RepID=A0A6A5UXE3_9PLEO|nr:hypothetical protein BU23DRAFT_557478 [Bimuria novae-zelandiae CBS 107.79]
MPEQPPSTPQRYPSTSSRRRSSLWPSAIPPKTPVKSVSPKEYLTALSNLVSFASTRMDQVDLDGLIWAFNHAYDREDRIAMRNLATTMFPTFESVGDAYYNFCDTRGTFDEEEIWNMVMGLGDDGSEYWDVVDELGDLIEIMEGEETAQFWKSMEEVLMEV